MFTFLKKQAARKLHRMLAYTVAILLFWLSLSGVLLNHTQDLNLNETKIQQPWLLSWYGIDTPKIEQAFHLGTDWVTQTNQAIYWNETALPFQGKIRSIVQNNGFVFIMLPSNLALLTDSGDLIDRIPLPAALHSSATSMQSDFAFFKQNSQVMIATKNNQAWLISEDFTQLRPLKSDTKSDWIKLARINSQSAPTALQKQLLSSFDSPLTLEKIILELHNGYFFGKIGPWLIDLASLLFILMVISGVRLHLRK